MAVNIQYFLISGVGFKSFGDCKEDDDKSRPHRERRDDEENPPETTEPVTDKPCPCPKIHLPMCGKDGVTYSNRCEMACKYVK